MPVDPSGPSEPSAQTPVDPPPPPAVVTSQDLMLELLAALVAVGVAASALSDAMLAPAVPGDAQPPPPPHA